MMMQVPMLLQLMRVHGAAGGSGDATADELMASAPVPDLARRLGTRARAASLFRLPGRQRRAAPPEAGARAASSEAPSGAPHQAV